MQQTSEDFTDLLVFWLRWIAVIPVGLLAALLSTFVVHLVVTINFDEDFVELSESGMRTVEYAGYAFAFPIAFTWAGSWVAPAARTHVVALLAILWVACWALVYVYFLVLSNDDSIEWDVPRAVASVVLGLIGVGIGGKMAHKKWVTEEGNVGL